MRIPEIIDLGKTKKFSGKLIICPTPIGNLRDLTLRNLEALKEADVIVCEDTRHTGKLLKLLNEKGIYKEAFHWETDHQFADSPVEKEDQANKRNITQIYNTTYI